MSWFDSIGQAFKGIPGAMQNGADNIAESPTAQKLGKATGLSPYMKMFGMAPTPAAPQDRMAKPSELADVAAGRAPATPGASGLGGLWDTITGKGSSWSNDVVGDKESHGFKKIKNADGSSGGYKAPSYQNWSATGRSWGNRQADIDARDKPMTAGFKPGERGNQKQIKAPEIYSPDLSKLTRQTEGQKSIKSAKETSPGSGIYENNTGAGAFTDKTWNGKSGDESSMWTSHTDEAKWGAKTKIDPLTGKGYTSFLSGGYQGGAEYKTGYRAGAMSDDKRYTADAEAGFVASAGASTQYGLDTKNGLYATGGMGAKVGFYGEANADAKSHKANIGGVDFDAGIGVHGEVFAGAKAGMGATVGLGPDFIGAKGNIGAFVGAEAAADIHGNLGPLAGKVGASGMVGAGIGADGDISFKDGKFHIGGKMFAALGYGGSLSGDVTIDFAKMGKAAYGLGASGLDYAGKGIDAGIDYAGKGIDFAGKQIDSGIDYAGKKINSGIDYAGKKIDYAGKKISAGADYVGKKVNSGIDYAGKKIDAGIDYAGKKINSGIDYAGEKLNSAGKAISSGYHATTDAISSGASSLYNGAASLFSW